MMTPAELEATVLAQGCLVLALADKAAQQSEPLARLLADRIARENKRLVAGGDDAAHKTFKVAYRALMARVGP